MPLVLKPSSRTCRAERLARAAASPAGSATVPSGKVKGVSPAADAREKVTLDVPAKVNGSHILNASFIHIPRCNQIVGDQLAQPCGRRGIELVVVIHRFPLSAR